MVTFRRTIAAIIAGIMGVALLAAPAEASTTDGFSLEATRIYVHPSRQGWCLDLNIPVASTPGGVWNWDVATTYCHPFRAAREIDVLTHGATYTRTYWDWPTGDYSYVGRALADGRAVLNYDRIGNGASTRPASSTEITMGSDAVVLHQLVQLARLTGARQVNSVGHSYGSGVILAEARQYKDVDSLVITGYLHRPSNPQVTAGNYPANQDPKFQREGLDDGWLTTRPGTRAYGFHSISTETAVIELDEKNKDLVSRTGLLDFLAQRGVPKEANISNEVKVPVLVMVGQQDAIFCYDPAAFDCTKLDQLLANEAGYYQKASDFKVISIRNSGHDLTLHPSADSSYQIISDWVHTH